MINECTNDCKRWRADWCVGIIPKLRQGQILDANLCYSVIEGSCIEADWQQRP